MPVHDAMYTHNKANALQAYVNALVEPDLYDELEAVKREAVVASQASAKAAVHFFNALDKAMNSSDKELAHKAFEIFSGPYNAEIA